MVCRVPLWLLGMLGAALVGGCRRTPAPAPEANAESAERATADAAAAPAEPIPLAPAPVDAGPPQGTARSLPPAGTVVRFAEGSFRLGSPSGEAGRDPAIEADFVPQSLAAFDIDALPYPNDPAQAPQTGLSRVQAEAACAARGRRLCGELEWERACKGPDGHRFPGGAQWVPACGQDHFGRCATPEGVFGLGARFAEWTRDDTEIGAVIRGAGAGAAAGMHRCAARRTAVAAQAGLEVAFRCCGGASPSPAYPREVSRRPFREDPMSAAQIAEIIRAVPELERLNLRDGLALFNPGAITEVMNHGATTVQAHPEATFTVSPVRWSPTFGEEIVVLTARSRVGSWIAALWPLPDGGWRHAGSFLLRGDLVPITLAWTNARREVQWSACWNCPGEHGAVTYTDENRVVIVQR